MASGIALNSFLSETLNHAPRTTNMWSLELNSGIGEVDKVFANLTMYAQGFQLPARSIDYKDLYFRGVPIPVPVNPKLTQEVGFKMWADIEGRAHAALRYWQDSVIDMDFQSGSYLGGARSVGVNSTIRLNLLDNQMENTVETVTLHNVTIMDVGEIDFTQEAGNIAMFNCKVKFTWPSFS